MFGLHSFNSVVMVFPLSVFCAFRSLCSTVSVLFQVQLLLVQVDVMLFLVHLWFCPDRVGCKNGVVIEKTQTLFSVRVFDQ